jgi:hypothetical protein
MKRFNLNKLKKVEGKEQYQVEISGQMLRWILTGLGKLLEYQNLS